MSGQLLTLHKTQFYLQFFCILAGKTGDPNAYHVFEKVIFVTLMASVNDLTQHIIGLTENKVKSIVILRH